MREPNVLELAPRRARRAEQRRFQKLMRHGSEVHLVLDEHLVVTWISPNVQAVLGYHPEALVGRSALNLLHPDDVAILVTTVDRILAGEIDPGERRVRVQDVGEAWRYLALAAADLRHDPDVEGVFVRARDVTDQQRAESELSAAEAQLRTLREAFRDRMRFEATHDPLTGLPNRALLLHRLRGALARSRHTHRSTALLMVDLDHFRVVNDSLGHAHGDDLLIALAERLVASVGPRDTVARFGGDEFVILCEDLNGAVEADQIAECVVEALDGRVDLGAGTEVFVSASIGIAVAEDESATAEDLLRDADAAMHRAKAKGRSRTEAFDVGLRATAVDRFALETDLRRSIDRRELQVLYQPIIHLESGEVEGVEALLRWQHPERGLLVPADFLHIAEESRLIVPIGRWVLAEACQAVDRVRRSRRAAGGLALSVNLSPCQLGHPALVDELRALLADAAVAPGQLALEITESALVDDVDATVATLDRIKAQGIGLAVDDFGTGYCSLSYLRRFPVDQVKVDRGFVAGLGREADDAAIVAAVVNLAATLGLRSIAEGVETTGQLEELRRLGCDLAQGYLISPPLAEPELADFLREGPWRP